MRVGAVAVEEEDAGTLATGGSLRPRARPVQVVDVAAVDTKTFAGSWIVQVLCEPTRHCIIGHKFTIVATVAQYGWS